MYYYFYKITNNINQKFYYGVHTTNNLDDGYMGSGKLLPAAYKKYGIENFSKEILKFFDTMDEAYEYEHEVVNEDLIKDENCYNIQIGGRHFCTKDIVVVKDSLGNIFWISKNDEKLINKEVVPLWLGKHHKEATKEKIRKTMTSENSTNNRIWVNKDGIVKYLLKSKLEDYINAGWSLGRAGYCPRKNAQGKEIK